VAEVTVGTIVKGNQVVSGIEGNLNVENPTNFNYIVVNDSGDNTIHTITLSTFTGPAESRPSVSWGQIVGLCAQINYVDNDTSSVSILGGDSTGNFWNVQAIGFNYLGWHLGGPLGTVTTNIVAGGPDTVNVGNNGLVSSIQSPLNISNSNSRFLNTIDIIDSRDTTPHPSLSLNYLPSSWGQIAGLAPAAINFENNGTNDVQITSPSYLTWHSVANAELVGKWTY
jgi:hypothetical protein